MVEVEGTMMEDRGIKRGQACNLLVFVIIINQVHAGRTRRKSKSQCMTVFLVRLILNTRFMQTARRLLFYNSSRATFHDS